MGNRCRTSCVRKVLTVLSTKTIRTKDFQVHQSDNDGCLSVLATHGELHASKSAFDVHGSIVQQKLRQEQITGTSACKVVREQPPVLGTNIRNMSPRALLMRLPGGISRYGAQAADVHSA